MSAGFSRFHVRSDVLFPRFVWIARGLSLSRRIRHLEERWAYYLAFGLLFFGSYQGTELTLPAGLYQGLPSAAFCTWGTGLANAAVFALVFPAVSRSKMLIFPSDGI